MKTLNKNGIYALVAHAALGSLAFGQDLSFNRDIRPILSDNCFLCHGFDPSTRAANLRLDQPEGIVADLGGRQAVVPGKPEESELYKRIHAEAGIMPPPESHKTLDADQKAKLTAWIEQGAVWERHWAFEPIERPAPPQPNDPNWAANPIDLFIQARLEKEGLHPSPAANRHTLIRRVSFDTRGVPPSRAEIETFVNDEAPDAYERMVDRLLADPRYGEHRARYWLDAARYADTHGFHLDNYRSIWPYRDWVVKAFNDNMPFDQFSIEQLAGDLLPDASQSQKVATGFNRCNPTTSEGGAIDEEYYAIYAADRVEATSTIWLGLTMGCAACHDHKFDPLTQRDFYQMSAFFRNTTQKAMDGNAYNTPPSLYLYSDEARARKKEIEPRANELKKVLSGLKVPTTNSIAIATNEHFAVAADVLDTTGHFSKEAPFSISFWIHVSTNQPSEHVTLFGKANDTQQGWSVILRKDHKVELRMIGETPWPRLTAYTDAALTADAWNHVVISYDGLYRFGAIDNFTFTFKGSVNGASTKMHGAGYKAKLPGDILNQAPFGITLEADNTYGIELEEVRLYTADLSDPERILLASTRFSPAVTLTNALPKDAAPIPAASDLNTMLVEHRALTRALAELKQAAPVTLVMQEKKDAQPFAHMLDRGQYDLKLEKVGPGMPEALPPLPEGETNRLALARWLMQPDHPLPARVNANRMWLEVFGAGIVKTAEDFGSQGTPPTHPELLDWLAAEFIESGWDMKHMYKLMLMSSTYRQSSNVTPEGYAADPENLLFARGPRYRLDAETLRDQALTVGALLVEVPGGPPVKPYQPQGVWKAVAYTGSNTQTFEPDHGDALYRRSLYSFWKRTAPPPSMSIFDAPSRERCTVRRERTNTPLQALVLLNDPQYMEAARGLAERTLKRAAADPFREMLWIALGREPEPTLIAALKATYDQVLPLYQSDAAAAQALVQVGESPPDTTLDPAETAAWTIVANQVMNMDEFITKN